MKKDRTSPEYQACLGRCASVPMDICERAVAAMRLAEKEKPRTNKWVASDLAESGLLSYAAFVSGRLNVEINLKEMTDVAGAKKSRGKLDKLETEADALLKEILKVLGA
jgi:formiminotetrahydrofolate cyclodeaminase